MPREFMIIFLSQAGGEEAVDNSRLPNVEVAGGLELSRVAGENSRVVRQVVVQAEIGELCVDRVAGHHSRHHRGGMSCCMRKTGSMRPTKLSKPPKAWVRYAASIQYPCAWWPRANSDRSWNPEFEGSHHRCAP